MKRSTSNSIFHQNNKLSINLLLLLGVYELFDYRNAKGDIVQYQPLSVGNQNPKEHVITFHPEIHDLTLTLPKAKPQSLPKPAQRDSIQKDIVWQVTYELHKANNTIECHRGYFKLDEEHRTTIDLRSFVDEKELAWIRVQGYDTKNPQRRAWFQAIKGPMFGKIDCKLNFLSIIGAKNCFMKDLNFPKLYPKYGYIAGFFF